MKRFLPVLAILLTSILAFAGKNDADKWRVMVKQLDVYETSSPDSRIIGNYNKFDCPDVKGPRVEKMIGVNYENTLGYVFESGLLEPGYMPSSSKFYEASVEDAIVIQRNNGQIPDDYTLKGMYDIWDNDNTNLPVVEGGDFDAVEIDHISNNGNPNYVYDPAMWQKILMWIIAIASVLCAYGAAFHFKWSARVLMLIAVIELLYFVIAPNALYFTHIKEFNGGEMRRVLDTGWVYVCFILQLFAGIRQLSCKKVSQIIQKLPLIFILATAVIFVLRFGVSAFLIGLVRDVLKLVLSLVGLTLTGIILYAMYKDSDSPSKSSRGDSSDDSGRKSDACCNNCIYFDTSSAPRCSKYNSPTSSSDHCNSHIGV